MVSWVNQGGEDGKLGESRRRGWEAGGIKEEGMRSWGNQGGVDGKLGESTREMDV